MEYFTSRLVGEQLSSVEFVQDYLQLHFDGRTLTTYIWPSVSINNCQYFYSEINYKNMLCQLIGTLIKNIHLEEKKELKIIFEGENNFIRLDLDPHNPNIVAEIAMFYDTIDKSLYIFE